MPAIEMQVFALHLGYLLWFASCSYVANDSHQCLENSDCGEEGICSRGVCECSFIGANGEINHLKLDAATKKCTKLVGSICFANANLNCVSNSHCQNGVCICNNNYTATSNGECRLNYGLPCEKLKPACNAERFFRCNLGLGICTCANDDEQVYDEVSGSCRSRPGERCEIEPYGIFPPCVENSYCRLAGNTTTDVGYELGICTCNEGFQSNTNFCLPIVEDIQDGHQVLALSCSQHSQYDFKMRKCRILANSPCSLENNDVCTHHAICENARCQCTSGYNPSSSGHCQLQYGAPCLEMSECYEDAFLLCIDNSCKCPDAGVFDEITEECVLRIFSTCEPQFRKCPNNSKCDRNSYEKFPTCKCDRGYVTLWNGQCGIASKISALFISKFLVLLLVCLSTNYHLIAEL